MTGPTRSDSQQNDAGLAAEVLQRRMSDPIQTDSLHASFACDSRCCCCCYLLPPTHIEDKGDPYLSVSSHLHVLQT